MQGGFVNKEDTTSTCLIEPRTARILSMRRHSRTSAPDVGMGHDKPLVGEHEVLDSKLLRHLCAVKAVAA